MAAEVIMDAILHIHSIFNISSIIMDKDIVRNCSVKLYRQHFSKIRIKCTAESSEKNIKLVTAMKQTDTNTFLISVKRKHVVCESSRKRIKIHHDVSTTCKYINYTCNSTIYFNSKNLSLEIKNL